MSASGLPSDFNLRHSQPCPELLLLGVEQTSISGGWRSACSQRQTHAAPRGRSELGTLRYRRVGAVHCITSRLRARSAFQFCC